MKIEKGLVEQRKYDAARLKSDAEYHAECAAKAMKRAARTKADSKLAAARAKKRPTEKEVAEMVEMDRTMHAIDSMLAMLEMTADEEITITSKQTLFKELQESGVL